MQRLLPMTVVLAVVLVVNACSYRNPNPRATAEEIIAGAEVTVSAFKKDPHLADFKPMIDNAKGVVVLPTVIKAAFIAGGEGGNGVLLVRRADGTWGYPAFYTLAAGSFGIQGGIQDTEVVLVLRSQKAVDAVLKHQGKLGADAGITMGVVGAGMEASTTTNLGADVLAFAHSKLGVYGGITLEGAALVRRKDLNEAFYTTGAEPQDIVMGGQYSNAKADSLRHALAQP